ncbi:MAG: C69 family dipeptidase [Candidatus Marinimicrobia bacterium]|nr:C69 family dipeptidase [Candidatus Neomarinimicrobiota bacterium]
MKKLIIKLTYFIILILSIQSIYAKADRYDQFSCFSILVGKNATIDGSTILAHNEDDYGKLLVDWYKVPRLTNKPGTKIELKNGGQIEQVNKTYSFIWLEMPGMEFSDSYMNEWGVTITSNECQSKEAEGELINGGIGYYLRRIMVERAKSAKEAIKIAGEIIDSVGYSYSGRSYCIADPDQAWIMSVVKGKHWVAQRIPDDHVVIIPNYYTIEEIDLKDTVNFSGAADIVDYATQKGWYDPESGKEFNFRMAYGSPASLNSMRNIARKWHALNLLSEKQYDFYDESPFSFKPRNRLAIQDVMLVLQNHYEGTQFEMHPDYNAGNPHENVIMRICSATNQYGFVAQLRNWLPTDIGSVLWIAPRRPCVQPFIPWYFGINSIPDKYTRGDYIEAIEQHFTPVENIYLQSKSHAFWVFVNYAEEIDKNYGDLIEKVRNKKTAFEKEVFEKQDAFEKKVLSVYKKNPKKAKKMLTSYTSKLAIKALSLSKLNN